MREKHQSVASHACPNQGRNLQSRRMPWPETEPATFWFMGRCSNQVSHTNQGCSFYLCLLQTWFKGSHSGAQTKIASGDMGRCMWTKAWRLKGLDHIWGKSEFARMGRARLWWALFPTRYSIFGSGPLLSQRSEACESPKTTTKTSEPTHPLLHTSHRHTVSFCFDNSCFPALRSW